VPTVDRTSPLPLWAQVLEVLRRRIAASEFSDRFPTDRELMDHYGVSRHTVRDAVRRLQEDGVLERERGRGTFVRSSAAIEQPLGALYSLFRSVEDQGLAQRSEVRFLDERTDPTAAAKLALRADDPLVYLERVRLADDEPIAVDCSYMAAAVARPLLDADFSHTALYHELAERCGVTPTSGWERIRPELASEEARELLRVGADHAVFAIERLASSGDRPIEWRNSVVRGDRYVFVARWSGGEDVATGMEHT
jgi:GntR family transcriptional regulator